MVASRSQSRHSRIIPQRNKIFYGAVLIFIAIGSQFINEIYGIFSIYSTWLLDDNVWFPNKLTSLLLLLVLPFLTYLSLRLFQLNHALQVDEETIRRLHQRNEGILQAAGDGIFGVNGSGQITFINHSAARMLGTAPDNLWGKPVSTILQAPPGETLHTATSALEKTLADGQIHLFAQEFFYRRDGSPFPVEYSSTPLDPNHHQTGVVVTFRDISQRLETEAERNRLAAAVNQTAEMILITDPDGHIHYANPAFETITGYGLNEVLGAAMTHFPITQWKQSWNDKLSLALSQGIPFKQRFLAQKKNGSHFHADLTWSPVKDHKKQITSHVIIGRDVTRELELGRQLLKSRQLESIGTLAGGIAHDFNNILTAILSYTELTMDELEASSLEYHNLNEVMVAAVRAKELVKQLLTFSRRNKQQRIPLPISPEIKEALSLLKTALPDKIVLETTLPSIEDQVLIDPLQIHQVVMNLCTNAVEAMENQGGTISVRLEKVRVDEEMILNHASLSRLQPGPHMVLSVKDQGPGIEPSVLDHLYEPFFTTKDIGKGSGLGLSVVHGIVHNHEGAIKVESISGLGATFQVYLPIIQGKTAARASAEREDEP
ncbi:MAG: PAS domain S-box protein [Magnetococcales bacterium]|nr:PAS domain S-box protein [Magnetococcales bacterium]